MPFSTTWVLFSALATVVAVQLFYFLFFFLRIVFKKNQAISSIAPLPVSVVICAKNEEKNLVTNLESWMTQDYHFEDGTKAYEVVLVDDNSDDGSDYLYRDLEAKYKHLRIVVLKQEAKGIKGKKFPLSIGIKEAKHEQLILTDADCKPTSNLWIANMAQAYQNPQKEIVLGYGAYKKYNGFLNKWIRWESAITAIQYFGFALAKVPYMGVGRNLSYHKKLFIQNKGFSSHSHLMSGDDDLFINQVATSKNTAVCMQEEAFTVSEPKYNTDAYFFQKKRHLSTGKYYKPMHKFLLGLFSITQFLSWAILIACIFFPSQLQLCIAVFLLRWIVQFIVFSMCLKKLREFDLIPSIWLFDFITVFYHIRMMPYLFIKPKEWK
jgi:glycosyltransferase involved in cell wall biosynthesis